MLTPHESALVIAHVTVLDMTDAAPLVDQTVVIEKQHIAAIGPSSARSLMSFRFRLLPRVLMIVLLVGCSAPVDIKSASTAGKKFHDRFSQQNYGAIYAD